MPIVLSVMNLLIILLWSRVSIWTEHVQFLLSLSRVVFALSARLYSVYVYWDSLGQQWLSFGIARNLKILIKRCEGLLDLQVWGFGCDEWESLLCSSARIKMSYFAIPSPSYVHTISGIMHAGRQFLEKKVGKVVSVHSTKALGGVEALQLCLFLHLAWMWVVSIIPQTFISGKQPQYPLNRAEWRRETTWPCRLSKPGLQPVA